MLRRLLSTALLLPILLLPGAASASPPPPYPGDTVERQEMGQLIEAAHEYEAAFTIQRNGTWSGVVDLPASHGQRVGRTLSTQGENLEQLAQTVLYGDDLFDLIRGPATLELSGPLRRGQELEIALPTIPSTGYSWVMDGVGSVAVESTETRQFYSGLGAPAQQTIHLRADGGSGTTTRIHLSYRRPWEREVASERVLSIQAEGVALNQVCSALSIDPEEVPTPTSLQALEPPGERAADQDGPPVSAADLPSSFNWCDQGACTPVRDQGACGSCWAFGTAGPLESNLLIQDNLTRDLSEQYLLSCNEHGWDCGGGWWAHDYHWNYAPGVETEAGAVLESVFPYQANDSAPCAGPYDHPYRILSWAYIDDDWWPSVEAIQEAIYHYGPVGSAICADDTFHDYADPDGDGVFENTQAHLDCENQGFYVNHAVVLVGWDGDHGAWIVRNSWGPDWADGGYGKVAYGIANVGYAANYIVRFEPTSWVHLPLVTRNSETSGGSTVSNGGFENGRDGSWTEDSFQGWVLILQDDVPPVTAHGGAWLAWLGGGDYETSIISQDVTIPAGATTLDYWYWSASKDSCGFDYAYVRVGSDTLRTYELCESNNTGGWSYQQVDISAYQGQAVELSFVAATDSYLYSDFFLDDVSLSTTDGSSARPTQVDRAPSDAPGDAAAPRRAR